ncbi:MAG: ATP-binding protein [Lentisphaeraceae bacterium]|nr:ATP-binding protein [Lentisphaeraceae bacterium]
MKLSVKINLFIAVVLTLLITLGYYMFSKTYDAILQSTAEQSRTWSQLTIKEINKSVYKRIKNWQAFLNKKSLSEALEASNKYFDTLENRDEKITRLEKEWVSVPRGQLSTHMESLINNKLAKDIIEHCKIFEEVTRYKVFSEVFITNKYGLNIAQTNRTSDFRQDDEPWWQLAREKGIHVTAISFDESAKVYSTNICLRIKDSQGKFAGVIKVVVNIEEILSIIEGIAKILGPESGSTVILYDENGKAVYNTETNSVYEDLESVVEEPYFKEGGVVISEIKGEKYLIHLSTSKPIGSFSGLNEGIMIRCRYSWVFAHIDKSFNFLVITTTIIIVLVFLFSYLFSYRLAKRIGRLSQASEEFKKGNLPEISDNAGDELTQLYKSFTEMTHAIDEYRKNLLASNALIEQKNIELAEESEKAKSANRSKSLFLSNVSHEIRTPMNAIMGFAELIEKRELDPKTAQFAKVIHNSGKSLLRLIEDILDLSKIEAGKLKIEKERSSVKELLREIEQLFTVNIEEKNLEFYTQLGPAVPDWLLFDELRLKQVLINLMGNALKFTSKGSIKLEVHWEKRSSVNGNLIIKIIDSGCGIPEDQQKIIFESFEQVKGQDRVKYGGTGLGLSISRQLVKLMDGEISLISHVGEGSTFKITLYDVKITS